MKGEYFVDRHSIVRRIWGRSDTILFIFAGAAAEFALNKAVDWLYFTGRLPVDPLGRLFSTVSYAKAIIFSEELSAIRAIDAMTAIHSRVEVERGAVIPDWAYRDVLFMLIDYSIRSFEVLERRLTADEKIEVFEVFTRVGDRMGLRGLPATHAAWGTMRQEHLSQHLVRSVYTDDLFHQYRKHLGPVRYRVLLGVQSLVVPQKVRELLCLGRISWLYPLLALYKISKIVHADGLLRSLILPSKYRKEIKALDRSDDEKLIITTSSYALPADHSFK